MGRARYFHTFNDLGTELLLVGGYQYASDWSSSSKLPLCIVELNTPLFTKQLSMTLGFEGDFQMTSQKNTDKSWDIFNYDIYLQFTYALPKWRFTVGNRVMFYERKEKEGTISQKRSDTRDNANACVIFVPDHRNLIQLGYYRKYFNPAMTEAVFEERSIHQMIPVYGCLSVNKQFGRHWNLGVDWHDMFDAFCSDATVNRHAANVKLQYRF